LQITNRPLKIFVCFLILIPVLISQTIPAQEKTSIQMLRESGISFTAPDLVNFLEKGIPRENIKNNKEKSPVPYTQLMLFAIEELAKVRYKKAVPVLIKTAEGNFTPAQQKMIKNDILSVPRSKQEERKKVLSDFLKYNSTNALGLIGDPAALPVLQEIFDKSDKDLFKTESALAMCCLDFGGEIFFLVKKIESKDKTTAIRAARALSYITGMELDLGPNTPVSRRKRTIKKVKKWWKENKDIFRPDGKAILERRFYIEAPLPPGMNSIRELLITAGNYADIDNKLRSFDAREKLASMSPGIASSLPPFCLDKEEDLNLRIEAIRRYTMLASKSESLNLLKKIKRDKNPEIRDVVKNLIKDVKKRKNQ
jgi:PBS lyase HEAT-like repeat-containing protein